MPHPLNKLLLVLLLVTTVGCSDSSGPDVPPSPEVSFIRPAAGQDFSHPVTVEIAASAVDSITLLVGPTRVQTLHTEPFQWTIPLEMLPAGEFPLKVLAAGPGGQVSQEIWIGRHFGRAPLQGDLIPDFHLPDADGSVRLYSELRAGRPGVLSFWASWCPFCRMELPTLQTLFDDYTDNGLHVMGVGTMEEMQNSLALVASENLTFPNLYDPDLELYLYYRANSIPRTFLIDADGIIRHAFIGLVEMSEIRPLVEQMLGMAVNTSPHD